MAEDGTKQIDRDAKLGLAVSFVLAVASQAALGFLNTVDLSTLPGWAASAGTLALSTAIGFLTTYNARKRSEIGR